MSPKKSYFILFLFLTLNVSSSCFILTAVRVKIVLMVFKNGKIIKSCCYQI